MDIREYMRDNLVFMDGAMGTLFQQRGLRPGECPEEWNLTHAAEVTRVHRDYFDAGSNIACANTFGANPLRYPPERLEAIVAAALDHARAARAESKGAQPKFIALDIGPLGRLLKPYGDLDFEDAVAAFAQTVRLGAAHGAELVFIETMNDCYETKAALLAARENCALPVFVANVYGADGKLMTGASPEAMVALLEGMGADAIGVNCSLGPRALAPVVRTYLRRASVPVIIKPNAGMPRQEDQGVVYDVSAGEFAEDMADLIGEGVRIAGGCCGTTPEYIAALIARAGGIAPRPIAPRDITCISSNTHALDLGGAPVLIGERINPTGKKRFEAALRAGDMNYILSEGIRQQECGVHALDVNVGLPEIDEPRVLAEAVCRLQAVIDLPLQIDTSDAVAMERALRLYNGKPLINSVNGKPESMETVFPLARKYGGVVIALTLDERGIPDTAQGRLEIARRILERAAEYGIARRDIVFDPLAMAVSAAPDAARVTLDALELIRRELGCCTSLGVSNVSFGLPGREGVNAAFFSLALGRGLSAAIVNPFSTDMLRAYHACRVLMGQDDKCAEYIEFVARNPQPGAGAPGGAAAAEALGEDSRSALQRAILKGLKEPATAATRALLTELAPLDVVRNEVIPALDEVGRGYEAKRIFLPQLLMSAEAAKCAFEEIKRALPAQRPGGAARCPFVIATVHGDVHDIGKNIVRLLLENYGFEVTDLGRDVPVQAVVDAVVERRAPLVGLSALMTTTVPAMEETIRALRAAAPWCKVVVGGAVLTKEYAERIGADKYARDAMETVRYAEQIAETLA